MNENYSEFLRNGVCVKLPRYAESAGINATLWAYLDFGGLTGAYTDTLCENMLAICRERGELAVGGAVVEACGGTFAVSLASACARQGHPLYLVMPADTSFQRQEEIREFGAKISTCAGSTDAIIKRAEDAARELSAYFLNYFSNDANCEHHRRVTGPAIMRTCHQPSAIVAGVGSGGTISGVGESVKAWHPDCKIIAVEPYESRAISGGIIGRHGIPGLGVGFVPKNYNGYIVDKVVAVQSINAQNEAKQVQLLEGIPASAACGAVLCAAKTAWEANKTLNIITCIFPSRIIFN